MPDEQVSDIRLAFEIMSSMLTTVFPINWVDLLDNSVLSALFQQCVVVLRSE